MKKTIKKPKSIFDQEVTLRVDKRLNEVKLSPSMQKKLDEANELLRKAKLPDEYYNR